MERETEALSWREHIVHTDHVDELLGQHFERVGPLRSENDEFAELVVVRRVRLERQDPGPEAIGVEVVVLDGLVAPDLVMQIRGLVRPAHVDAGDRALDNLHASVAQFLVHQGLDAVDRVLEAGNHLGPLVACSGVVLSRPEWDITGASPEDEPRTVGQGYHHVLERRGPAVLVFQGRECPRPRVANRDRHVVAQPGVAGAKPWPAGAAAPASRESTFPRAPLPGH